MFILLYPDAWRRECGQEVQASKEVMRRMAKLRLDPAQT